jgi:hypothetical protein
MRKQSVKMTTIKIFTRWFMVGLSWSDAEVDECGKEGDNDQHEDNHHEQQGEDLLLALVYEHHATVQATAPFVGQAFVPPVKSLNAVLAVALGVLALFQRRQAGQHRARPARAEEFVDLSDLEVLSS